MISFNGREIPETLDEIVSPKHTVLIVHEMLNDWLSAGGYFHPVARPASITEMLGPMITLINAARENNVKVIYANYTQFADYRTLSDPDVLKLQETRSIHGPGLPVVKDTWGNQVIDELRPQKGDIELEKYKVDAFVGTTLDLILRWNHIKTIAIMGVGAFPGILSTVSHAYNLGYYIVSPVDCIKGISQAALVEKAMEFIGKWSIVTQSSELINSWKSAS